MQTGIFDFLEEIDKRTLKSKGFTLIKQDFIITSIHSFCAQLIIEFEKKEKKPSSDNTNFLLQKDLDRELENRIKSITQVENQLGKSLSNTKSDFLAYINSLKLPSKITERFFPSASPGPNSDMLYVYSREFGGSKILTREAYEDQKNVAESAFETN